MSKKICFDCNYENDDLNNYCNKCGAPLDLSEYISNRFKFNIEEFFEEIKLLKQSKEFISDVRYVEIKNKFKKVYDYLIEIDFSSLNSPLVLQIKSFLNDYENLNDIIHDINENLRIEEKYYIDQSINFKRDFENLLSSNKFIPEILKDSFKNEYKVCFNYFNDKKSKNDYDDEIYTFLDNYENLDELININNIENVEFFIDMNGSNRYEYRYCYFIDGEKKCVNGKSRNDLKEKILNKGLPWVDFDKNNYNNEIHPNHNKSKFNNNNYKSVDITEVFTDMGGPKGYEYRYCCFIGDRIRCIHGKSSNDLRENVLDKGFPWFGLDPKYIEITYEKNEEIVNNKVEDTTDNLTSMEQNLSPEQLDAVRSYAKKLIIKAGPGAGKTRVLVERVKFLLKERHVNPKSILVITFTQKAAEELRNRLNNDGDLTFEQIDQMYIGTIHGFCRTFLRNYVSS